MDEMTRDASQPAAGVPQSQPSASPTPSPATGDPGTTTVPKSVESPASSVDQKPDDKTVVVPIHVVQSLRDEIKKHKDEAEQVGKRLASMELQAELRGASGPSSTPPPVDPLANADLDDPVSVQQVREVVGGLQKELRQTRNQLLFVQAKNSHADFDSVLAQGLQPALNANPALVDIIARHPQPFEACYRVAQTYLSQNAVAGGPAPPVPSTVPPGTAGTPEVPTSVVTELDKIISANMARPGDPGQVGGGGSPQTAANRWASMSKEEFQREVARVTGRSY